MRVITCEQVSDGHPDKICDQVADAIVTDCLRHDKKSRVAIECLIKDAKLIIAGELTSKHKPDYRALVDAVMERIGREKLSYRVGEPELEILVREQSADIALGVDEGGAGDQGMMYGYATNETPEMLPIPYAVATKFLIALKSIGGPYYMADAKAQVSYDYDSGRITTFLCSVQHKPEYEPMDFAEDLITLMKYVAEGYGLNTDFTVMINPTGRFVEGGSFADCGVTGRKLACDTYGGVGRIGGGAMSGKDPTKVDRSGAYIARKIAKDFVREGYCDRCEVQIAYAIGVEEPVSVHVETFGTEKYEIKNLDQYIVRKYDLTPWGIIMGLGLLNVDFNEVSAYGHFTKALLPWEK